MKAIRVYQTGEPDVMRLEDVPEPKPADDQVLVRIRAIGVNPVETYIRSGRYPLQTVSEKTLSGNASTRRRQGCLPPREKHAQCCANDFFTTNFVKAVAGRASSCNSATRASLSRDRRSSTMGPLRRGAEKVFLFGGRFGMQISIACVKFSNALSAISV